MVSHADLCIHFPPGGLPALHDLRLYGTKLTSNLDYRGEATVSLAATLKVVCIATQQTNTAIVLAQQLRSVGKHLEVGAPGCHVAWLQSMLLCAVQQSHSPRFAGMSDLTGSK